MKKIFTISFILLSLLANEKSFSQSTNWGAWSTMDCYPGFQIRVKIDSYNESAKKYHWIFDIKSTYNTKVFFTYQVEGTGTSGRTSLGARQTSNGGYDSGQWTLSPSNSTINLRVTKVRFGYDDHSPNCNGSNTLYADCDISAAVPNWPPKCDNNNQNSNLANQQTTQENINITQYNRDKADIERQLQEENQKIADRNANALRQQEIQRQQEVQQQELKRQQDAQRTAAYVDLGVTAIKGASDLVKAFKEDKLAKIEKAKNEAEQKAANEEMERQWVIAQNHANEKNTDGYLNAIHIMLPYAKADRLNGMALNKIGFWYDKIMDHSNAIKWYKVAADKGDSNAMFNLGISYENGQGVSKNIQASKEWYMKACKTGYKDGCKQFIRIEIEIANSYENLKSVEGYKKAIDVIKPYVYTEIIDGNALNSLGFWYFKLKDYTEGKIWFEEAISKFGNENAMYNLGVIYEDGLGTTKNYDKSAMWYKKACNRGEASACKRLERINKVIKDSQNKITSLIPVETSKELGPNITVQYIIDKNVLAIGGLEKINNVKTLTEIYEDDGVIEGTITTTKTITANGKRYFETTGYRSLDNYLEGYKVENGKKTKLKKEDKNSLKDFKPLQRIILSDKDYKLGKIETIEGVEHNTFIHTLNTQEYSSSSTFYYNTETGLLKCRKSIYNNPAEKINVTSYTYYDDYRTVEGILFPFIESEVRIYNDKTSKRIKTYKKIAINDINEESNLK